LGAATDAFKVCCLSYGKPSKESVSVSKDVFGESPDDFDEGALMLGYFLRNVGWG
jgi:hypothetical protein